MKDLFYMNVTTAFLSNITVKHSLAATKTAGVLIDTQLHITDKTNFPTHLHALDAMERTTAKSLQRRQCVNLSCIFITHGRLTVTFWDETLWRRAMTKVEARSKHKRDTATSDVDTVSAGEGNSLLGKFAAIALGTNTLKVMSKENDFFAGSLIHHKRAASNGAQKFFVPLPPDCVAHFDNTISTQPAFISPAAGAEVMIGQDGIASVETKSSKSFGSLHPFTLRANQNQRQQQRPA